MKRAAFSWATIARDRTDCVEAITASWTWTSEGIFSFAMVIFSLMGTSAPRGRPIVTVPAS